MCKILRQGLPFLLTLAVSFCGQLSLAAPARAQASSQEPSQVSPSSTSPDLESQVRDGFAKIGANKLDLAEQQFKQILERALQEKNKHAEASARGGLGTVLMQRSQFPAAREQYELALTLFKALGDRLNTSRVENTLGDIAVFMGENEKARNHYSDVLVYCESTGDIHGQAHVLFRLSRLTGTKESETKLLQEKAYAFAEKTDDKILRASILQDMGDNLFHHGDFDAALEKLSKSAELSEKAGNKRMLSYVLTSMGRVQRAQGHPELALGLYQKALEIQREFGDQFGVIQSLNALAVTYQLLNEYKLARTHYEEALVLSRESGSPKLTDFILGGLAELSEHEGDHRRAAELLEELLKRESDASNKEYRFATLGRAYAALGQYEKAVEAANQAIILARQSGNEEWLPAPILLRARAEDKLGQTSEALADVREDLSRIEILRTHLAPSDFYKRDYSDWHAQVFSFAIDLLSRSGEFSEALETSERARARGFLDLLASHRVALGHAEQEKLTALEKTEEEITLANAAPQVSASEASMPLEMRGAKAAPAAEPKVRITSEPELPSMVSAGSASLAEMQEQARRLHSIILSYWVGTDSTVVWVLDASNAIHSASIPVKRDHLVELVQSVWPRGHSASPLSASPNETAHQYPKASKTEEVDFPARGEAELKVEPAQKDHWRELYQLLIQPIEAYLPANQSRITIIPHGPLFALPFAGLRDSHDRYFLERYTLEYAPAISALRFTGAAAAPSKTGSPHYLFVADPSDMQKLGLPQLPGSQKEVSSITAHLPSNNVTVLIGPQAQEQAIRTNAAKSTIIHFATHGIVNDAQPFDSFLALSDGKLTARDIYGLNLNADLVFLSACRSGMGKVTGDGVLGLTRAFLYAGTRSVVATLWDVADEPTARLVAKFYGNLRQGQDKAQALRSAQLSVLSQLRTGKLQVATHRGPLTLPENPVFWASFVLIGEP